MIYNKLIYNKLTCSKKIWLLPLCLLLTGCFKTGWDFKEPQQPQSWTGAQESVLETAEVQDLKNWWQKFDDPALNQVVDLAMAESPDRLAAEARIMEARGLRRSARGSLFPELGASAAAGRQDTGFSGSGSVDEFYDARFDASYEIDIFGRNRNNFNAADSRLETAEAAYHDITLTLIADIVRNYIDYRGAQNQARIARKNLELQEETLRLIKDLYRLGESPKLDVERGENLVNTTRASVPEFERQAEAARLRLSVLTGALPENLKTILKEERDIPGGKIEPVLMAPAQVLSLRPDIRAASANLEANTSLAKSATAEFFPVFNLSGFYGISDGAFVSSTTVWEVALGAAITLLDFGRIEGRIDAARAREKEAYELYRKTVIEAVTDVETALSDYAHIRRRHLALHKAFDSAHDAFNHSKDLYKEGEIAFLDVIDAQRTLNDAEAAVISAHAAEAESITRLYKSLGVY